ncbi:reverse transcriptase domain-containing protein [Tanacetum coccineum]
MAILLRFNFLNSLSKISIGSSIKFNLASTWISSKGTCSVGSAKHFLRTLNEAKRNYAPLEKLALSLLHMSRRQRRKVGKILCGVGNIQHNLRTKECHQRAGTGRLPVGGTSRNSSGDGASNSKVSRAGLVLISLNGMKFTYALRLNFTNKNNKVEYKALLAGLRMAARMNVQDLDVKVDLKLVNIPRNLNQKADILSKLATVAVDHLTKEVLVEVFSERSTNRKEVNAIVEEEDN